MSVFIPEMRGIVVSSDTEIPSGVQGVPNTQDFFPIYLVDSSGGDVDITLPIAPTENDKVGIYHQTSGNTVTIERNGKTIGGASSDKTSTTANDYYELQYDGVSDWVILDDPSAASGGLTITATKTANYTAVAGDLVACDVNTTGSFTVTLPGSPSANDQIGVYLMIPSGSNTITIARNGNTIGGAAADQTLYVETDLLIFQFNSTDSDWAIIEQKLVPHSCKMHRAAAQSITISTNVKILHDIEDWDIGQIGDLANSKFTIRRAGKYHVSMKGYLVATAAENFLMFAYLNAAQEILSYGQISATSSRMGIISFDMDLAAGDDIEQYFNQSNSTQNTSTSGRLRPEMSIHEIL